MSGRVSAETEGPTAVTTDSAGVLVTVNPGAHVVACGPGGSFPMLTRFLLPRSADGTG